MKKYFKGGLNADSDFELLAQDQWVNAENMRMFTTDSGAVDRFESVGGNALITNSYLPSGVNECIGGCEDESRKRLIWFVKNSLGNHAIFCYEAATVYQVILNSQVTGGLNFSTRINDAYVIDNILYWINSDYTQCKINVDAGIKLNHSGYTTTETPYISPLEADVITVIRKPPHLPLLANKFNDPALTVNQIKEFAGQFAARYIFRDGETSVLSPISNLVNYNSPAEDVLNLNYIYVNWTTNFQISQDVQQVDFCVRYGDSGNFYVIKSWNKNNAADAAAIAAHNAGTGLQYKFLNDRTGIVLDNAYSTKSFDFIPFKSKAFAPGLSRLIFGNNLVEYNSPSTTSLAVTQTTDTNTTWQNPIFKGGGVYKLGVQFRDRYRRPIGGVVTNDNLFVQIPERDYAESIYTKELAWTLSNTSALTEIPFNAYYYDVVISKNLRTSFFVQAKSKTNKYAIKDPITGVITYNDTYALDRYGLAFDMSYLLNEGMGYTFSAIDFVKIYKSGSSVVYNLPVIAQDGDYVIVRLADLGSFATAQDIIVEIYTPYKESGTEPYYTYGAFGTVVNPATNTRTYGDVSGNIKGDIFVYGRNIPSGSYNAENMSPANSHWKEWLTNTGTPYYVFTSKEKWQTSSVYWSNTYLQGTNKNGLSTFDVLDKKILPLDLGDIQKLIIADKMEAEGNIMLAVCTAGSASLYLGETQLLGADGNGFVGTSGNVIGSVNVLNGGYGTSNPESVFTYNGLICWFDKRNGSFVQYSNNGLFPISQNNFTRPANLFAKDLVDGQLVIGGADPYHKEFLWSLPQTLVNPPKGYVVYLDNIGITGPYYNYENQPYPFDIYDGQPKTIFYKSPADRWVGAMMFTAEQFLRLGNAFYSFKNGNLYVHNQSQPAFFYGEQKRCKIMFADNPGGVTQYLNIAVETNKTPFFAYFSTEDPYIQKSDLVEVDFTVKEGIRFAPILRDQLSPNVSGFANEKQITGDKLFGKALMTVLDWDVSTQSVWLKFFETKYR